MLEACPGAFINIGNAGNVGSCPVHNPHYDFNDETLPIGASLFARLVEKKIATTGDYLSPIRRLAAMAIRSALAGYGTAEAKRALEGGPAVVRRPLECRAEGRLRFGGLSLSEQRRTEGLVHRVIPEWRLHIGQPVLDLGSLRKPRGGRCMIAAGLSGPRFDHPHRDRRHFGSRDAGVR
jgi:hypothetical protein